MSELKQRLDIVCPCCQAKLTLDPKTGLILRSEHKKADYSLEEALEREEKRKSQSDQLFADAFSKEKKRRDSLEDKFQEALKSKDELDEPPPRPWDLD